MMIVFKIILTAGFILGVGGWIGVLVYWLILQNERRRKLASGEWKVDFSIDWSRIFDRNGG